MIESKSFSGFLIVVYFHNEASKNEYTTKQHQNVYTFTYNYVQSSLVNQIFLSNEL